MGRQEWGDPLRVVSENTGFQEGGIVMSQWGCAYMYIRTLFDTTCFNKVVMTVNLSELSS
jgi:hypothetical protein